MFASTADDVGHSSRVVPNDPYDGQDDTSDVYDNEPLIVTSSGKKYFVLYFTTTRTNQSFEFRRWKISESSSNSWFDGISGLRKCVRDASQPFRCCCCDD